MPGKRRGCLSLLVMPSVASEPLIRLEVLCVTRLSSDVTSRKGRVTAKVGRFKRRRRRWSFQKMSSEFWANFWKFASKRIIKNRHTSFVFPFRQRKHSYIIWQHRVASRQSRSEWQQQRTGDRISGVAGQVGILLEVNEHWGTLLFNQHTVLWILTVLNICYIGVYSENPFQVWSALIQLEEFRCFLLFPWCFFRAHTEILYGNSAGDIPPVPEIWAVSLLQQPEL